VFNGKKVISVGIVTWMARVFSDEPSDY